MTYADCERSLYPWRTPVYTAQCVSFALAKKLSGHYADVSIMQMHKRRPYCLRVLPAFRTPEIQAFRDEVAAAVKELRNKP
jgi:hypothetical protein